MTSQYIFELRTPKLTLTSHDVGKWSVECAERPLVAVWPQQHHPYGQYNMECRICTAGSYMLSLTSMDIYPKSLSWLVCGAN